jgi:hypothetical protein
MYSVGTRSWNKSLIEFTKIRRDERHRSGCSNFSGHEPDVEALFEWMAGYAAESFGKSFRVAVFAAWADLGTATHRIPRGVGPLDRTTITHELFLGSRRI